MRLFVLLFFVCLFFRKWQEEREKLIQCIHLQQLELTQRSMAAHERALDIAKDFGKVISSFEERLVTVETNIQKEISSLRAITDSLLAAYGKGIPPPPPSTDGTVVQYSKGVPPPNT
jgi:hypothetical protein